MTGISKNKVASSLVWKFFERIGSQGVTFVLSIILARILSPTEYGLVALITVFISIATVFVQGGFNTALIQNKKTDNTDFSSVLYFSLTVAVVSYFVLFFSATFIADFYRDEALVPIVRVLALILFPGAFNSVQVAFVTKRMQFRKLFLSNLIGVITSGVIGIIMAYTGFGVWAIVAQQLGTQTINCIVLLGISEWRPKRVFAVASVKQLIPFGSKVLASNLLVSIFLNIRSLIIGRVYDAESLAYFNRGNTFVATIMDSINGTIQTVMLPTYSILQDEKEQLKRALRESISLGCYIIFPCLLGLAAVARPFIILLLTEKWEPAIAFLQIFAIGYMMHPIQIATAQALKAIGRSDLTLKIEIYRKIAEVMCLLLAMQFGVSAIAWSTVAVNIISCLISAPTIKRDLGYMYTEQLSDIAISAVLAGIMFVVIFFAVNALSIPYVGELFIGIIIGIVVYFLLSLLTNNNNFHTLLAFMKGILNTKLMGCKNNE